MMTDTVYVYTERSSAVSKKLINQYKFRKITRKLINKFTSLGTLPLPTGSCAIRECLIFNISKLVHLTTCRVGFFLKKIYCTERSFKRKTDRIYTAAFEH